MDAFDKAERLAKLFMEAEPKGQALIVMGAYIAQLRVLAEHDRQGVAAGALVEGLIFPLCGNAGEAGHAGRLNLQGSHDPCELSGHDW